MRVLGVFFATIAVVLFLQFLVFTLRGGGSPWISAALFASFLVCLIPSAYLLSPFRKPPGTPRSDWRRNGSPRRPGRRPPE
jgi:hypothetical protein